MRKRFPQSCGVPPPGRWPRPGRALAAALVLGLLAGGPARSLERADLEAAIVYNILPFVDWPAEALPPAGGGLVLCVDPGSRLAAPLRALKGRPVRQSLLEVADLPPPEGLRRCHAVFLDASARASQAAVRQRLRALPVLVFGDEPSGSADDVVAVHLVPADGRMAFEIDMAPVRQSRLQISSRLLRLAKRVGE